MSDTGNRLYDEFAKLMNDAAGVAQSARREVTGVFRSQADRLVSEMDLAKREDIEIIRELAIKALGEVEKLTRRVAELEAKAGISAPTEATDGPVPDGASSAG